MGDQLFADIVEQFNLILTISNAESVRCKVKLNIENF